MSAFTQPILVDRLQGAASLLEREAFEAVRGTFSERWLQETLFAFPESLPIKEIDPHIGPLIPVCMELETGSGPADILFVTHTGQVVLVETKLWRNPEARREVVGQILDYAKQLTTWNYDVLEQKAAIAARADKNHLLNCLRKRAPAADETAFVDGVRRSLATGDFLLLIIGDGIRYGAETLVGFLERYGHLRFGLGLVEVAAYRLPDGRMLLQPRVLAKTEILQRTLFMGATGPVTFQEAAQSEDVDQANTGQREWFADFWKEVLSKMDVPDKSVLPAEPAKSTNQFFPMPPSGASAWISAYIAQSNKRGGVYLTFARKYEQGPAMYELLESDRESLDRELGLTLSWSRDGDKVYVSVPNVLFSDLNMPAERSRVTDYLASRASLMIRALKPRLQAASNELRDDA